MIRKPMLSSANSKFGQQNKLDPDLLSHFEASLLTLGLYRSQCFG